MDWSPQQESGLKEVSAWIKDPGAKQVFRLFGFAGTGKTTLMREVANMASSPAFAAFTGKAALMMRSKGCPGASTIHSLIYTCTEDDFGFMRFVLNTDGPAAFADLIAIDECSMVGEDLAKDLLSFGKKVLVIGDPAQLPPVEGRGVFTHGPGTDPDVMLTEIHRQAVGNPIIDLATKIRTGEDVAFGTYGESRVISRQEVTQDDVIGADQVLVGRNSTRIAFNRRIRSIKGFPEDRPVKGDKVVCLKNSIDRVFLNGGLWTVIKSSQRGDNFNLVIEPEDMKIIKAASAKVRREFFLGKEDEIPKDERRYGKEFTYGYALTTHKAQGSQWPNVTVFDESSVFREDASRWLYTAVTRAADRITVVR